MKREECPTCGRELNRLLNVHDAARELSMTEAALRAAIRRGNIPTRAVFRLGKRIRLDLRFLVEWMRNS